MFSPHYNNLTHGRPIAHAQPSPKTTKSKSKVSKVNKVNNYRSTIKGYQLMLNYYITKILIFLYTLYINHLLYDINPQVLYKLHTQRFVLKLKRCNNDSLPLFFK